jgi:hypothetical protein
VKTDRDQLLAIIAEITRDANRQEFAGIFAVLSADDPADEQRATWFRDRIVTIYNETCYLPPKSRAAASVAAEHLMCRAPAILSVTAPFCLGTATSAIKSNSGALMNQEALLKLIARLSTDANRYWMESIAVLVYDTQDAARLAKLRERVVTIHNEYVTDLDERFALCSWDCGVAYSPGAGEFVIIDGFPVEWLCDSCSDEAANIEADSHCCEAVYYPRLGEERCAICDRIMSYAE